VNVIGSRADRVSEARIHVHADSLGVAVAGTKESAQVCPQTGSAALAAGHALGVLRSRAREVMEGLPASLDFTGDMLADTLVRPSREELYDAH